VHVEISYKLTKVIPGIMAKMVDSPKKITIFDISDWNCSGFTT
jgi:hypothetical protein